MRGEFLEKAAMPIKKLTLMRHAKAVAALFGMDDHARALNSRGRAATAEIGIETADARPDLVLCSDAARTRETWEALSESWPTVPAVLMEAGLYLATPEALLHRLRQVAPAIGHVWLIGHNPGVHDLANALAAETTAPAIAFPTASRARFEFEAAEWRDLGPAAIRRVDFFRPLRE
jgi:phosphohistidine phosphatase